MADYAAYAGPYPPNSSAPASTYAQPPSNQSAPLGATRAPAALAAHLASLSIAHPASGYQGDGRAPLVPPAHFDMAGPPAGQYARSPSSPTFPSSAPYTAANRPRPQLSPVLTASSAFAPPSGAPAPPRAYQLHDGPSPSSSSAPRPDGETRVPRKSSLAAFNGASSNAPSSQPHQPLPPLPLPTSSSYTSLPLSAPQSSTAGGPQRDSSGGEQVFNGAALAAGSASHVTGMDAQEPSRSASTATATAAKHANPLADLIATETAYVDDLGLVIKRVAAAWSRSNFPPPVLDAMFRAIEAVYRINKALLAKLLEIGPSPSSPKALGDLLMRWIDDIEPSYTRYATTLQCGFDTHPPVQANERLAPILASLAWPSTLPQEEERPVSLDALFALPAVRIAYYQRLYAKLLRSTQEGRSDHALLVTANDKLRRLAAVCDDARGRSLDGTPAAQVRGDEVRRQGPPRLNLDLGPPRTAVQAVQVRTSGGSAEGESPSSSSYRSSGATGVSTANTSAINTPLPSAAHAVPLRVEDLEQRLDTARTLDIFTMQPRKCKLQMQPASLPFTRQLRKAGPVAISFVPSSDPAGREVRIPRAHLVLLTDLFLVCAPVEPADAHAAAPGADYWLLYPPLAGKHLRARDGAVPGEVEVAIMGKERITFRPLVDGAGAEEQQVREWRVALDEAVQFGAAQSAQARQNSSASATGGRTPPPISPAYRANPQAPSFQTSAQLPVSPASGAPTPRVTYPDGSGAPTAPASASSGSSANGRPALQLVPPERAPPRGYSTASASPSSSSGGIVSRPERNASMLSGAPTAHASTAAPVPGGYAGGPLVQSPTGAAFPHSPVGAGAPGAGSSSSRGGSPYPPNEPGVYGRQSPYAQPQQQFQQPQQQQFQPSQQHQFEQRDFAPPPPLQQGQGGFGYPTFPPPRSPHAGSAQESSSRPSSRQSNGSYASSQASARYPDIDQRGMMLAPPPLPKERSYNGVDISGRGGPLYPTSLNGSGPRGMLAPAPGPPGGPGAIYRSRSAEGLRTPPALGHAHGGQSAFGSQYTMPSQALLEDRSASAPGAPRTPAGTGLDASPPASPIEERPREPERTSVVAQMRCKIFLQQHHAVWKSLGTAKLKLFHSVPSGTKQLVVDSDKGGGKTVISTIVLTDGVERVGKTGVAIELSDQGDRTGIVYMLQMKTEQSATGLFEQLLLGTGRAGR
ncbi:hypothetical protein JCM3770_005287 [Rhodotorula araucariae]